MAFKISIITVTFNAKENLKLTIEKINQLTNRNEVEFIVIDGKSKDGSVEIVKQNNCLIDKWISEPDTGIYDAMNKGINLATGDWLIFINAGDYFYDQNILKKIDFDQFSDTAIVYGDTYRRKRQIITKASPLKSLKYGVIMACHQSIFFNRRLLKSEMYYDATLDYSGDSELVTRIYLKGYSLKYIELTIADYDENGLSSGGNIPKVKLRKDRIDRYKRLYKSFGIIGILRGLYVKIKFLWDKLF